MYNLIRNENVKIYRRLRTWIFAAIIIAAAVITGVVVKHSEATAPANWREQTIAQNQQLAQAMADPNVPQHDRATISAQMQVNQYRVDHNISPTQDTAWSFAASCAGIVSLITIFVAVVAGDSIAREFSTGTIKLLLIRPVNRTKILISKYLATLEFALAMILGLLVLSLLLGGILFGFGGAGQPYIYATPAGAVQQTNMFSHVLIEYGFSCVQLLMIVTISYMISAIFRSSSLAIALSILLMFLGSTAAHLLSSFNWDKYILFSNTDLSVYFEGQPMVDGMTLGFSIMMLIVYFIVFHAAAWWIFTRRDVSA